MRDNKLERFNNIGLGFGFIFILADLILLKPSDGLLWTAIFYTALLLTSNHVKKTNRQNLIPLISVNYSLGIYTFLYIILREEPISNILRQSKNITLITFLSLGLGLLIRQFILTREKTNNQ